jgi:hypothetical protein
MAMLWGSLRSVSGDKVSQVLRTQSPRLRPYTTSGPFSTCNFPVPRAPALRPYGRKRGELNFCPTRPRMDIIKSLADFEPD